MLMTMSSAGAVVDAVVVVEGEAVVGMVAAATAAVSKEKRKK